VAQWHFGEWGHHYPGGTVDAWLDHIRTRMNADRIPMTVVALDEGEPIGTAALTERDMETHRELSPWLGGVYVVPSARGRGVARALVRDVIDRAAARLFAGEALEQVSISGTRAWATRRGADGHAEDVGCIRKKNGWYIRPLAKRPGAGRG
jgi:GNAT superfamily N-acetyltransferase